MRAIVGPKGTAGNTRPAAPGANAIGRLPGAICAMSAPRTVSSRSRARSCCSSPPRGVRADAAREQRTIALRLEATDSWEGPNDPNGSNVANDPNAYAMSGSIAARAFLATSYGSIA